VLNGGSCRYCGHCPQPVAGASEQVGTRGLLQEYILATYHVACRCSHLLAFYKQMPPQTLRVEDSTMLWSPSPRALRRADHSRFISKTHQGQEKLIRIPHAAYKKCFGHVSYTSVPLQWLAWPSGWLGRYTWSPA